MVISIDFIIHEEGIIDKCFNFMLGIEVVYTDDMVELSANNKGAMHKHLNLIDKIIHDDCFLYVNCSKSYFLL